MKPLVSILIPVYNRETLIRECIASAQAQTYTDVEIVVCDNASSDGTWAIIQQMAAADKRIRAFRNKTNIGPVRNWMRCLAEARGELSKILFSDDLIAPSFLERLVPALENNEIAFAFSNAIVAKHYDFPPVKIVKNKVELIPINKYFKLLAQGRVPVSPGAALFRTKDARQNLCDSFPTRIPRDYWKHGAGPDVMLHALTACKYPQFAYCRDTLALFRVHNGSITIKNTNNEVIDGYRSALSWFFYTHHRNDLWLDYLARQWLFEMRIRHSYVSVSEFISNHEGTGNMSEVIALFSRAIMTLPTLAISKFYRVILRALRK